MREVKQREVLSGYIRADRLTVRVFVSAPFFTVAEIDKATEAVVTSANALASKTNGTLRGGVLIEKHGYSDLRVALLVDMPHGTTFEEI